MQVETQLSTIGSETAGKLPKRLAHIKPDRVTKSGVVTMRRIKAGELIFSEEAMMYFPCIFYSNLNPKHPGSTESENYIMSKMLDEDVYETASDGVIYAGLVVFLGKNSHLGKAALRAFFDGFGHTRTAGKPSEKKRWMLCAHIAEHYPQIIRDIPDYYTFLSELADMVVTNMFTHYDQKYASDRNNNLLYYAASAFNYACIPNATYSMELNMPYRLNVFALTDIPRGTEILLAQKNVIDKALVYFTNRDFPLKKKMGFKCTCRVCSNAHLFFENSTIERYITHVVETAKNIAEVSDLVEMTSVVYKDYLVPIMLMHTRDVFNDIFHNHDRVDLTETTKNLLHLSKSLCTAKITVDKNYRRRVQREHFGDMYHLSFNLSEALFMLFRVFCLIKNERVIRKEGNDDQGDITGVKMVIETLALLAEDDKTVGTYIAFFGRRDANFAALMLMYISSPKACAAHHNCIQSQKPFIFTSPVLTK